MVGLIDIFYFTGGIIFWVLGFLTFREYLKNRFKNELYLSLYFFSIGWLFPLIIFVPYNTGNTGNDFVHFLLIGANATIPLVLIFLNLFLDYTVYEGNSGWNLVIQFFSGGTFFMTILSADSLVYDTISTVFGEYTIINIESSSDLAIIVFYMLYLLMIVIVIRFIIIGIKLAKRNVNNENFLNVRRIILFMFAGQFFWIIISLLKRSFPEYLIGVDFLIISLFNMVLVFYYVKHHELFYFLPSSLKLGILIYKSGIHLCDYDFSTKNIDNKDSFDDYSLALVRSVLYGATIAIENVLQRTIGEENLEHINFENSKIVLHQSENIYWWLVCEKYSQYYSAIITKIANRIESKFRDEINALADGSRPSESFKLGVKDEFDRIS